MKTIVLLLISFVAFGQTDRTDQENLHAKAYHSMDKVEGFDRYRFNYRIEDAGQENKRAEIVLAKEAAVKDLSEYIRLYDRPDGNFLLNYYIGALHFYVDDFVNAKAVFDNLIDSKGASANSYNRRCAIKNLIYISISEKNFKQALNYIDILKADKNYSCGNDAQDNQEYIKKMIVVCNNH